MRENKVIPLEEALSRVESGMTIAVGGFIGQGDPLTLIDGLKRMTHIHDLTIVSNDAGFGERGIVELVRRGMVRKMLTSHVGTTPYIGEAVNAGDLEIELMPQGTFVERVRCGGAGLGGVLTPVGVGTEVENGKPKMEIEGRTYLLETAIHADVAFVRAHVGDWRGNLVYRGTSRNHNPNIATCADYVIAEVETLYCMGELDPESIHTQGIYIDAVVRSDLQYCVERPLQPVRPDIQKLANDALEIIQRLAKEA